MSLQEDAKRLLPFVQAAAEGEKIEVSVHGGAWSAKNTSGGHWNLSDAVQYRIKPEPKYRPYTREEWERVDKVREKSGGTVFAVTVVFREHVRLGGMHTFSFESMLEQFTHLDGTPCGVEVTE